VSERKLHRLGEESKNGLLFLLVANAFDFVAAEGAKIEIFPTAAAHASHAILAHNLFAMRASVRNRGRRVARAKQRAILENDWRHFENGNLDFRNGDVYISRFNEYLNVTGAESLAGDKPRLANGLAIDESAVGGFAIAEDKFVTVQLQFTMEPGNRGMNDLQIGVGTSS